MIIRIASDCRIVGEDGIQFTVQRRRSKGEVGLGGKPCKRAGEVYWENMGYHGTLAQALQGVLKHSLLSHHGDVMTARELMKFISAFETRVKNVCEGVLTAAGAAELDGEVSCLDLDELLSGGSENAEVV